jgi:hypothetical protein
VAVVTAQKAARSPQEPLGGDAPPTPTVPVSIHNAVLSQARVAVDKLEPRLADIVERILVKYGRLAASKFTDHATDHLNAAGPPGFGPFGTVDWTAPFADQLLNIDAMVGEILAKTQPVREALIQQTMTPALAQAGLAWNTANPLIAQQIANTGTQIRSIADTTRANIMQTIGQAADKGLTIPQTAKLIRANAETSSAYRSTMIARTELGRAVSGASLAATQMVSNATGDTYNKTWHTAPGATYPRHEDYDELDGQTVPLDSEFDVGGEALQYPGDPDGDPSETINCRCAMDYMTPSGEQELEADSGPPEIDTMDTAGGGGGGGALPAPGGALQAPLTPLTGHNADTYATSLTKRAAKIEPAITDTIKASAEASRAELVGLDFRLKSEASAARKIASDAVDRGMTEAETAQQVSDMVRFTASYAEEDYVAGTERMLADLQDRGMTVSKFKNTWTPDAPYAGINVQLAAPNGYRFELQFHTPSSFQLKDKINHPLYEEWRLLDPASARAQELTREMIANTAKVPVPPGVRDMTFERPTTVARDVPSARGPSEALAPGGPGGPGSVVSFTQTTDYATFNRALAENARPGFLTVHTPEELASNQVYLSADGKAGFSISSERDLQNVFRNEGGVKGAGRMAVHQAVQDGARTLDAYDGFLPDLYQKEGFAQVGRMAWSDEFAPEGWNYAEYGRPDVVFMATNPVPGVEVKTFTDWEQAKAYSLEVSRPIGTGPEPLLTSAPGPALIVNNEADAAQALMDGVRNQEILKGKTPDETAIARGVASWKKNLKGNLVTDPAVLQKVADADAYNMGGPVYADQIQGRDTIIVISDNTPVGNVLRPGGDITSAGRRTGNEATVIMDEATRDFPAIPTEAIEPGKYASAEQGGLPALLRHEYGHQLSDAMTADQWAAFRARLPAQDTVKADVSKYAGQGLDVGNAQEAYSELFAITTDPAYRPGDWAPWVQQVGHEMWGTPLSGAQAMLSPTQAVVNETISLDPSGKDIDAALASISDVVNIPDPLANEDPITAKIVGEIHVEGLPPGSHVQGAFTPTDNSIQVRRLSGDRYSVFTHEFGHAVDHASGPTRETLDAAGKLTNVRVNATSDIIESGLQDWAKAIEDSPTIEKMAAAMQDGLDRAAKAGLDFVGNDLVYVDGEPYYAANMAYTLNPAELFARSFTQYMSQTDDTIAVHVAEQLDLKHQNPGMWYWDNVEFAPIAAAMHDWFEANGMLATGAAAAGG